MMLPILLLGTENCIIVFSAAGAPAPPMLPAAELAKPPPAYAPPGAPVLAWAPYAPGRAAGARPAFSRRRAEISWRALSMPSCLPPTWRTESSVSAHGGISPGSVRSLTKAPVRWRSAAMIEPPLPIKQPAALRWMRMRAIGGPVDSASWPGWVVRMATSLPTTCMSAFCAGQKAEPSSVQPMLIMYSRSLSVGMPGVWPAAGTSWMVALVDSRSWRMVAPPRPIK
mmetsp:Transcript_24909/g.51502  ORF Transcript_24909/g.51502 Transcript_24909/m.51502 type:complete len:226 (-) Transcript_24909:1070-1747(-)